MKGSLFGMALAGVIAMVIPSAAQTITIEPDSLDFGEVALGAIGRPESNRDLRLTLRQGETASYQVSSGTDHGYLELMLPAVADARAALRLIYDAVGCFRHDMYEDPDGVGVMRDRGYLRLDSTVVQQWEFEFVGSNPIAQIVAVSTDQMPDGGGHQMVFDPTTGRFTMYGPLTEVAIPADGGLDLVVAYEPYGHGEDRGLLDFVSDSDSSRCFVSGSSHIPYFLTPSAESLDFGHVFLDERGRRELRLRNTSGLFLMADFEFSDPNHFAINNQFIEAVQNIILDIVDAVNRFHNDHNEDPNSVEQLMSDGYLQIGDAMLKQWSFTLLGANPLAQIEATSTELYQRGPGHVVLYDIASRRFSGLGVTDSPFPLGSGREDRYFVTFLADTAAVYEGELHIRAYPEIEYLAPQVFTINLRGAGALSAPESELIPHPSSFIISAFPNPFNDRSTVRFSLPKPGAVHLEVYDPLGRRVRDLIPGSWFGAGTHSVNWDAAGLPTGTYIIKAKSGGGLTAREMVKVK